MSNTAVLIPTRLKSTRLPNKPLVKINGKPLIQHVWEHAIQCHPKEDVYIASGDQEIVDIGQTFGAKCVLTDPSLPSGTDRIAAALDVIDPQESRYDTVVNFQGDGLNVDPKLNTELVNMLHQTGADIATVGIKITAKDLLSNPNYVKIAMGLKSGESFGRALYFSRSCVPFNRDNIPDKDFAYWHIGIYVYKRAALKKFVDLPVGILEETEKLEQLRALENGMSVYALIVPSVKLVEAAPADINTPEELAQAEKFFTL